MIALACDHGGLTLKKAIKAYFDENFIEYIDFGTDTPESVDYPVYAKKVAVSVATGESSSGILCCGTGIGMSIVANKQRGIRAAVVSDGFCTEMCRRHNNANVLCLGGRVIAPEKAVELVKIFIETPFDGGRHEKRVEMFE